MGPASSRTWSQERILAVLWLVGSLLTAATLLVPYEIEINEEVRAGVALSALLVAVALWAAPPLPEWVLHAVLAAGALAVALCTSLGVPDVEGVMFLLPSVYAFATFPARRALPHLLLGGALYALVLAGSDEPSIVAPGGAWLLVMGVGAVLSFAIARLSELRERERTAGARDRRIAETLQRALLPEELPAADRVSLAACYRPAEREADVGGDLYGTLVLADGRLALVIGDVAGKGLIAAAEVGRMRAAWRAYAVVDPEPASVLRRLDDFMHAEPVLDGMTTLLTALVDPASGTIAWASAGHLPPLHLPASGVPAYLEGPVGPPLGVATAGAERPGYAVRLSPGDGVLLYTDGLVERRDAVLDEGLERLRAAVAGETGGAEDIMAAALGIIPERRADDVAALALRLETADVEAARG